jgi:hypothetical protein
MTSPSVEEIPLAPPPQGPKLGFWREPVVQDWLPLVVAIVIHLVVLTLGITLAAALPKIVSATQEQTIIPEAAIVEGAQVGGIPNPGLGGDPNLSAAQNAETKAADAQGWSQSKSETLNKTLLGSAADESANSRFEIGPNKGFTPGNGNGDGGGGGPLAPLGVPGGGTNLGPKSPFMGISGNAKKVVYICDASGSMMSVFWRVKQELHKAVDVLRPIQAFNVIFFSDVEITTLSKSELVMATPDNKRRAFSTAEQMSAAGSTDPLPAIRLAFQQKPELIYVLTDGFDNVVSFDAVIQEFRKLNADKKVRVNTILIKSTDNPELEKVVRTIASENGGVCKVIDRQDM